jgi:hypothetical protein
MMSVAIQQLRDRVSYDLRCDKAGEGLASNGSAPPGRRFG